MMLFNIFTPDEVDFLKQLVGDDVVEKLEEEDAEGEGDDDAGDVGPDEESGEGTRKREEYVTR